MSALLDLDDVAATSELAQDELRMLRARLAELEQFHDWAAPQLANPPQLPSTTSRKHGV